MVVNSLGYARVSDQVSGELAFPNDAAGATDFRYEPSTAGYQSNFKTTGLPSGGYLLFFRVSGDGPVYSIPFQVR